MFTIDGNEYRIGRLDVGMFQDMGVLIGCLKRLPKTEPDQEIQFADIMETILAEGMLSEVLTIVLEPVDHDAKFDPKRVDLPMALEVLEGFFTLNVEFLRAIPSSLQRIASTIIQLAPKVGANGGAAPFAEVSGFSESSDVPPNTKQ